MKKLILALFAIVNTACAHPHYVAPARSYVYSPPPVVFYDYQYSTCYPRYYNNWYTYSYTPRYCVPPGISFGYSFNNGRSFGRVRAW